MNIRLYIRSICRSVNSQWMFLTDLKNLFFDTLQIFGEKKELNKSLSFNKDKLEKKKAFINSVSSASQTKNMNLIR